MNGDGILDVSQVFGGTVMICLSNGAGTIENAFYVGTNGMNDIVAENLLV